VVALSCNEIAHVFAVLVIQPGSRSAAPVAVVVVATTTSGPRPHLPLPATSTQHP
jgi:hypothetical protein